VARQVRREWWWQEGEVERGLAGEAGGWGEGAVMSCYNKHVIMITYDMFVMKQVQRLGKRWADR
jgi:hypothetical protein